MALTNKLTAIADAIRGKTGKTEEMTLDQMPLEIAGIQTGGGGDTSAEDGLVEKNLTEYRNSRATSIGEYLFYKNTKIQKVTFDSATTVTGLAAFRECSALTTAIFPSLTKSGNDMFYSCKNLSEVKMPNVKWLDAYTFQNCSALKKLDFNCLESIGPQSMQGSGVTTLIIRTNIVCTLMASVHSSLPANVTVYVPAALITEYQQATNWSSAYADGTCNFVAIEGSEYE